MVNVGQEETPGEESLPSVSKNEIKTATEETQPDENTDHSNISNKNNMSSKDNTVVEYSSFVRPLLRQEMIKGVVRKKLGKQRHLVLEKAIDPSYLDSLFPQMLEHFDPQTVNYNGGIGRVPEWRISCYLEVMDGGVPTTHPNLKLQHLFEPLLSSCNRIFVDWYRQQHACNDKKNKFSNKTNDGEVVDCKRIMTFITRYTPAPGEQALLKHVDGAGKVDGSAVVALPIDRWSAPEEENTFEGGGLTFWDGPRGKQEIKYDTRSGDLALIDRAVWHQANPITKGTRWALVIFYKVIREGDDGDGDSHDNDDSVETN